MIPYLMAAVVVALVVGYFVTRRGLAPGAGKLVDAAIEQGSVAPIVEAAGQLGPVQRSALFQQALTILWEEFQRPLAVQLAKEYAAEHSDEKICQFWLKQAMEVEPLSAKKTFDDTFLKTHYRPEVAACCGKTSS